MGVEERLAPEVLLLLFPIVSISGKLVEFFHAWHKETWKNCLDGATDFVRGKQLPS